MLRYLPINSFFSNIIGYKRVIVRYTVGASNPWFYYKHTVSLMLYTSPSFLKKSHLFGCFRCAIQFVETVLLTTAVHLVVCPPPLKKFLVHVSPTNLSTWTAKSHLSLVYLTYFISYYLICYDTYVYSCMFFIACSLIILWLKSLYLLYNRTGWTYCLNASLNFNRTFGLPYETQPRDILLYSTHVWLFLCVSLSYTIYDYSSQSCFMMI